MKKRKPFVIIIYIVILALAFGLVLSLFNWGDDLTYSEVTTLLRDGKHYEFPTREMNIDGKKIYKTTLRLQEDDVFIAMSDGCPHAGMGGRYNFGWRREEIADYMQTLVAGGYTARHMGYSPSYTTGNLAAKAAILAMEKEVR